MLYRESGHLSGQADALNSVGWSHAQLGDYQAALEHCGQALALQRELGNRPGAAAAWDSIGYAHHHLGEHGRAIDCYEHAIVLHRELGNRYWEAKVLTHLGDTQQAAHGAATATTSWKRALDILVDLGHCDADDVRARLRKPR